MAGVHMGVAPQPHPTYLMRRHLHDWLILVVLSVIVALLNLVEPFHRYLSEEMLSPDIKYPFKENTSIKDAVGRPRPNFFFRSFPDGKAVFQTDGDVMCTNVARNITREGYKSFPSGHTSWSFAGLGFLGWYLCGKIKVFDGEDYAAKLCIVVLPYLAAALVGVSRVDDYWHHWTDVLAGALTEQLKIIEAAKMQWTAEGRTWFWTLKVVDQLTRGCHL